MTQKMIFSIVFHSLIIKSSFITASYLGDVAKKDRKTIEDCLFSMRQKYFEEQNFLENDIQVVSVGQKVKIIGLDQVIDHIDFNIQASTNFQANSLEILDEYCKSQSFAVTSHINQIISGLKKKIPKEFDRKNGESLRSIKKRQESLNLEEKREFSEKNQKQKDIAISTILHTVPFFLVAIKAHEKDQHLLVKAIGLWYLKFLWDNGTSFYQEDLKFQEKLDEISLKHIACETKKDELESNQELKPLIQEELELFRKNKVEFLDEKLAEYKSKELQKISLTLFSSMKEKEKNLRKKIMEIRKAEMEGLSIQHQKLRSKILLKEQVDTSSSSTESSQSNEGAVKSLFSKVTSFFGF